VTGPELAMALNMSQGGLVLKLNKSLWDKAASNSNNTRQASAPKKKKRSSYSSDDCITCGSIALAGQERCITCSTGGGKGTGKGSSSSDGTLTLAESKSHSMVLSMSMIPAAPKIMPRFSLSSGGKTPSIVTTRKLQPAECSQLIEREILYIKCIQEKIPAHARGIVGPTQEGQELLTCLGSMTYDQIAHHLISLRIEPMQRLFRPVLTKFMQHPRNLQGVFNRPVDTSQEGLFEYLDKVALPMDLGTVRSKLQRGQFESLQTSVSEMRLVFQNAMTFNPPGHTVHAIAKSLATELDVDIAALEDKCVKETEKKISHPASCKLCGGEQCNICGEKCIKFESPVLLCHGSCMGRIKRNAVYYVSGDGMMLWCQRCYSALPQCVVEAVPFAEPPRPAITKRNLLRCKSDEEVSEPWVECDSCHKWVHQVCGLYNDRYEDEEVEEDGQKTAVSPKYECPRCRLESRALESIRQQQEEEQAALAGTLRRGKKRIKQEEKDGGIRGTHSGSSPDAFSASRSGAVAVAMSPAAVIKLETFPHHHHTPPTDPSQEKKRGRSARDSGNEDCTDEDDDSTSSTPKHENDANANDSSHDDVKKNVLGSSEEGAGSAEGVRAAATHRQWSAAALPRSRLSDFIESMVKEQLRITGYSHVVPSITIRMASNIDQYVEVPEPMVENLMTAEGHKLPKFLEYKQKCILLFQKIEGVDVCLFSLYVQEFGTTCPAPNKNCVYISYLDSVDYLRPVEVRTMVYHEIMIAYLKWSQLRGFAQAHIWACPPQRGDNFIFWCHPPYQRTPSRERLNGWYATMLERAATLGVVNDITTLYDSYFCPYIKNERDLSETRQAAKNSFVGAGKVVKPGAQSNFALTLKAQQEADEIAREQRESGEPNAPICPPVFEGDFWVNEFLRMHRLAVTRSATEDGQDRDLNRRKAREWLKLLMGMQTAGTFSKPVDPAALHAPDYFRVIAVPMDLGTVREKLRMVSYENMLALAEDIRLTFQNAMTYNPAGHFVHSAAAALLSTFDGLCRATVSTYSGGVEADTQPSTQEIDRLLSTYPLADPISIARIPGDKSAPFEGYDDESLANGSNASPRADGNRVSFLNEDGDDWRSAGIGPNDEETNARSGGSIDEGSTAVGSHISGEEAEAESKASGDGNDSINAEEDESVCGSDMPTRVSLRRQDSVESCVSATTVGSESEYNQGLSRRPFHSGAMHGHADYSTQQLHERFAKPAMGSKGVLSVMNDLARGVERLKSDLFVVHFALPNASDDDLTAAAARREARSVDVAIAESALQEADRIEREAMNKRSKKNRHVVKQSRSSSSYSRRAVNTSGSVIVQNDTSIRDHCLALARGLVPDTSDPDANIASPFVDSRHTFLEMCQFRHYQFDSLRRAKHSSQMVLFHLHNPYGANTRPMCVVCRGVIQDVRWHCCDGCPDSDTCQECYMATDHVHPEHKLTPYRVSFV